MGVWQYFRLFCIYYYDTKFNKLPMGTDDFDKIEIFDLYPVIFIWHHLVSDLLVIDTIINNSLIDN
mgnify:CR=1 FL=1